MPDPSQCPLFFCGYKALEDTLAKVKPSVIYDLGSNEGGWLPTFLNTGAKVHTFEPVPDMAQKVRDRWGKHPDVVTNQLAVSDAVCEVKGINVFQCWCLLPDNTRNDKALDYAGKPPFDMQCTTLDHYSTTSKTLPGFIKVDVDGYEFRVLRGGANLLAKHRPPMLFEFSFLPQLVGDSMQDMCRYIYSLGYEAVSMNGLYRCPTADDMIANFPEHSSYDIMLLPK